MTRPGTWMQDRVNIPQNTSVSWQTISELFVASQFPGISSLIFGINLVTLRGMIKLSPLRMSVTTSKMLNPRASNFISIRPQSILQSSAFQVCPLHDPVLADLPATLVLLGVYKKLERSSELLYVKEIDRLNRFLTSYVCASNFLE